MTRGGWDRLALLIALIAVVLSAVVALRVFGAIPHIEDEFAYLWQAEISAEGDLFVASPPEAKSFLVPFVVDHQGRRFGKYPPGWPVALALGAAAGAPWAVNPLLAGLAVWLIYRLACAVLSRPLAVLAAALAALSPMLLMLSGSLMSHNLSLVLAAGLGLAWFRLYFPRPSDDDAHPGLLVAVAGGCAGLLFLTRPLTAVGALTPFAVHGLWLLVRRPASRASLIGIAAVATALAGLLPLWQYAVTGDPWRNPYTLWWSYDRLGFGPGHGVMEGGHTLTLAYINTHHSLKAGLHDLFGWPYLSWLFLPFGWFALRRKAGARLLFFAFPSLVVTYSAYWIGAWVLGPRYYYESLPGLAIASAAGAGWLGGWMSGAGKWLRVRRLGVAALLLSLTGANVLFYWPARVGGLHGLYGIDAAVLRPLRDSSLDGSLIFVDAAHWHEYGNLLPLGPPFSERDLFVAWARGPGPNARLRAAFPEHRPLYYEPDQPGVLFRSPPPSWER